MPPDFLNSREDALLLWGAATVAFLLWTNARTVAGAVLNVVSTLWPKLLGLYLATYLFAGLSVWLAWKLGVWHSSAAKTTVYWFLGTALVLVGGALTDGTRDFRAYIGEVVVPRVVAVTVAIEFIANLYALPLAVEFVAVPLAVLSGGLQALVERDPEADAVQRGIAVWVPVGIVLLYLANFAYRIANDFDEFATRETAEDFLVAPVLTVLLIPWLYGWARFARWEQEHLRRRWS
jgi:hypothetical protein